jgi:hypothetical protein
VPELKMLFFMARRGQVSDSLEEGMMTKHKVLLKRKRSPRQVRWQAVSVHWLAKSYSFYSLPYRS